MISYKLKAVKQSIKN